MRAAQRRLERSARPADMLIAIQFEESNLATFYGDAYRNHKKRVSMIIPWPARK